METGALRRPLTIRSLLTLLIAAVLVPLLVLNLYSAVRYADAERKVIEVQRFTIVGNVSELLHRDIETIAGTLRTLAVSPGFIGADPETFRRLAAAAAKSAGIDAIVLYDDSGKPVASTLPDTDQPQAILKDLAPIDGVLKGQPFYVSDLLPGSGGRRSMVLLSVPVSRGDGTRYVLSALLNIDRFASLFANAGVPAGWTAGFVDRNGMLLARNRNAEQFVGTAARPEVQSIARSSSQEGSFENVTLENVPVANVYRRSSLTGWLTVVAVPSQTMNAPLLRAFSLLALAGMALTAIGLILASLLASRIATPLRRLSGAAVALVDGGMPVIENPGISELGEVQRAFAYAGKIAEEHRVGQSRLRSSELFFRLLLDSAAEGIFSVDRNGVVVICNATFLKLLGFEGDADVVGKKLHTIVRHARADGSLYSQAEYPIYAAARIGLHRHVENERFFRQNGDSFPIEYWVRPIYQDEELQGVVCTVVDITARQRTEAMNAHLAAIVASSGDAIKSIALDGTVLSWNEGAERLFGYSAAEMVGNSLGIIFPEGRIGELKQKTMTVGRGEFYRRETIRRRKDGTLVDILIDAGPIRDARGNVVGVSSIAHDITERKRIELELRSSESRFRSVFNNTAVGMAAVGLDGRWLMANARISEITGYSQDELLKLTSSDITHPGDIEADEAEVRDLIDGKISFYSKDKRYIRKDGEIAWVGLTVSLERDSVGEPAYFLEVVRDIEERKRAEEHQFFLMRELSHRSKNLLAVIQAMARQTARISDGTDVFIERFTQRLHGLATSHDLLVHQNWRHVPLKDLLKQQLAPFLDADSGRLVLDGPDVAVTPEAAQALGLALHELATNAAKYGSLSVPEGSVKVIWKFQDDDEGQRRLLVDWRERGGPTVVPPARYGFGHVVISRMAANSLDGKVSVDYAPDGLGWTISFPISNLAAMSEQYRD
ncbi:PAS domain S-box protein [Roseiarcaceae bacterium H3SJ34-1]|uniref:PAS domain S-box protein n=1 Tax=Terripilifer ovatus TaxID=3032367 RepID=UPI003AB96811|nr:PAS domain S-box protein [Roseiarcaceae bacterium H3SJ34-1]